MNPIKTNIHATRPSTGSLGGCREICTVKVREKPEHRLDKPDSPGPCQPPPGNMCSGIPQSSRGSYFAITLAGATGSRVYLPPGCQLKAHKPHRSVGRMNSVQGMVPSHTKSVSGILWGRQRGTHRAEGGDVKGSSRENKRYPRSSRHRELARRRGGKATAMVSRSTSLKHAASYVQIQIERSPAPGTLWRPFLLQETTTHTPPVISGSACMQWRLPVPSVPQPLSLPPLRTHVHRHATWLRNASCPTHRHSSRCSYKLRRS